jgi:hypothetical protein
MQNMLIYQLLMGGKTHRVERVASSCFHLMCTTCSCIQAVPSVYVLMNLCQQAHNGLPFGLP